MEDQNKELQRETTHSVLMLEAVNRPAVNLYYRKENHSPSRRKMVKKKRKNEQENLLSRNSPGFEMILEILEILNKSSKKFTTNRLA